MNADEAVGLLDDMHWFAGLRPEARRSAVQRLRQHEVEVLLSADQRARWIALLRQQVRASIERDFPTEAAP